VAKKVLLVIAALLCTTAAHADDTIPQQYRGVWCSLGENKPFVKKTSCGVESGIEIQKYVILFMGEEDKRCMLLHKVLTKPYFGGVFFCHDVNNENPYSFDERKGQEKGLRINKNGSLSLGTVAPNGKIDW
jgi:hypothetical protein